MQVTALRSLINLSSCARRGGRKTLSKPNFSLPGTSFCSPPRFCLFLLFVFLLFRQRLLLIRKVISGRNHAVLAAMHLFLHNCLSRRHFQAQACFAPIYSVLHCLVAVSSVLFAVPMLLSPTISTRVCTIASGASPPAKQCKKTGDNDATTTACTKDQGHSHSSKTGILETVPRRDEQMCLGARRD
jgi:hypothetical protein